jgi:membrane protease YdiL (CAAX protease family)
MVAVERPLGRRLRSLVWAYGLAPQFAPQAWRLGGLFTVAVVTYAVYVWSPLVGWLALSVAGAVAPALGQLPQSISMMFVVVVCALATVGTVLWLCQLLPATSLSFGFVKPRLPQLLHAGAAWAVTMWASWAVPIKVDPTDAAYQASAAAFYSHHRGVVDYLSDVVDSSIATPIVEETMFRGLLFAALAQWLPAWLAVLISSLAFALWHHEPYRIVPLTIMGLGLAYIYYRSGTLWAPIAAHAVNNWLALTITFVWYGFVH